ncbi:tetratricopeptide repeat-containing sensor histidine kinase [Chryseolinea soli]|nr:ATP-binding protein [Chryseolinea soli]
MKNFQEYSDALTRCKNGHVDSILLCAKTAIDIDTITGIDRNVWQAYATAQALFHNNLGLEAIEVIEGILPRTENPSLLFERAELLVLRSSLISNTYRMELTAEDLYMAADIYLQLGLARKASSCYVGIANLQYNTANYPLAIENGRRVIDLLHGIFPKAHGDSIQLMQVYNTIGLAYYKENNIDSAQRYYDRSYALATSLKEEFWQALVAGNAADIYLAKRMAKEAIESYENDIRTSLKHNDPTSAALSLLSLGAIYVSEGRLALARQYYDSAYALLSRSGRPISLSKYNYLMSQWFELKQDPVNAFKYYKRHITFRDSVQSIQINSQLQQIQNQKRFEKQRSDIALLKKENELKEKELTISRISMIAFVLVSVLLAGLLYIIRRGNKQLNELNRVLENRVKARTERLRKTNQELDTYLYRASHDVRRPITTILGLVQIAPLTHESERIEIFNAIQKTANGMDKMLKKLQMAYELEKERKSNRVRISINKYLGLKIEELRKEYPRMNFEIIESDQVVVKSNIVLVNIVMMNILENACIFSMGCSDHVTITVHNGNGFAYIVIKDQGIGIEPQFLENIFKPYVRCSTKSTGSGLGLYLAMKAAKLIGGDITASSTVDQGSEFVVMIR